MSSREEVAAYMRSKGVCDTVIADEAGYVAEHYKQEEGEDPFGVVDGSLPSYMARCGSQTTGSGQEAGTFTYQPPPSVYVPPVRLPGPNTPPVIQNGSGPLTLPSTGSFAPMPTSSGGGGLFASSAGGGVPTWLILAGLGVGLFFVMQQTKGR
jgi:hypothetical protein